MRRGEANQFARLAGSLMIKQDAGIYLGMGKTTTLGVFWSTSCLPGLLEGNKRSVRARMNFCDA